MGIPDSKLVKRTRRLELRPLRAGDYPQWVAEHERRQAGGLRTREAFREVLRRDRVLRRMDRTYNFSVIRKSDGRRIGTMNIAIMWRWNFQVGSLGYEIFEVADRRRGYATEAVRALCRMAFTTLKLHRLEAQTETGNDASRAFLDSLGFSHEGTARRMMFIDGKWVDLEIYSLLREDLGLPPGKPGHRTGAHD